jgi:ankyrin repeat protein
VEAHASVRARNRAHQTPLHLAAQRGHAEVVFLLARAAGVDAATALRPLYGDWGGGEDADAVVAEGRSAADLTKEVEAWIEARCAELPRQAGGHAAQG